MATTFAQRKAAAEDLMKAGLGLTAIAMNPQDAIMVHDPQYRVPTGGGKTPIANQVTPNPWLLWPGIDAKTAYGV